MVVVEVVETGTMVVALLLTAVLPAGASVDDPGPVWTAELQSNPIL
jgi:hypothetical protein